MKNEKLNINKRIAKSHKSAEKEKKSGKSVDEKKLKINNKSRNASRKNEHLKRGKSENQKTKIKKDKRIKKSTSKDKVKKEKKFDNNEEEEEKEYINIEKSVSQNNDLYALLGLHKSATNLEIRKAYKNLVLICHPDKNKTDPETASKFINITRAYKILSNEKSRKYYDETGDYDEENNGEIDIDNTLFFFRKIYSPQDIETFENKYIGSKEEEQDLINFYKENKGNISKILECIPCSKNEDVKRFIKIYEKSFKQKILKKNKNYEESKDKIELLKEDFNENKEAKETLDKLSRQIMDNKKRRNYNDYLDGLANKYGDKDEENGNKINDYEISEEEFQKISNRLKKGKKGKNKRK